MAKKIALFLALIFIFSLQASAYADDGYMGGVGQTPMPRTSNDIEMQAEVVYVVLHRDFAEVECAYRFKNHGKAQKVIMGFPDYIEMHKGFPSISQFRAFVNGMETPIKQKTIDYKIGPQTPYEFQSGVNWYLQEVTFSAGENKVIVNQYLAMYGGTASPEESFQTNFGYTLKTGATWKGRIKQANVIVSFASGLTWRDFKPNKKAYENINYGVPSDEMIIMPKGYKKEASEFSWTFKNFEPKAEDDIHIALFRDMKNGGLKSLNVKASSSLKVAKYNYPAAQAFDGNIETAWAEGAKGAGVGETIKATFKKPRQVQEIRILPGYTKTAKLFKKYSRPKTATLSFSNGTQKRIKFVDEPKVQYFVLDKPIKASWAKLTIDEAYRGSAAQYTYITEIEFAPGKTRPRTKAANLLSKIKMSSKGLDEPHMASKQTAVKGATVTTTSLFRGQVTDSEDEATQTVPIEATDVIIAAIVIIALIFIISLIPREEETGEDEDRENDNLTKSQES